MLYGGNESIAADSELDTQLDRVCQHYGIASREAAAEFLIKRRLRRAARRIAGRGRALYLARNNAGAWS
jgi:hypothetical protein